MKLFLPQKTLEEWSTAEKADLQDGKLVVSEGKSAHTVTPAVHFVKLVSGVDQSQLVGRVKTMSQLDSLGAEHMMDSVILGDGGPLIQAEMAEKPLRSFYFYRSLIATRGPGDFLKNRVKRIGISFLATGVLILPPVFAAWVCGWFLSDRCTVREGSTLEGMFGLVLM